ncbi:MAG: hypothetical protein IJ471_06725 [Eubacterium sp.]|nr:hypothetical protein [Eubacterium sp.]
MLQEAMDKVKAAEAKAGEMIAESLTQGQEMIARAREQAKQSVEDAIGAAKEEAAADMAAVKAKCDQEKAEFASSLHLELEREKQAALARQEEAITAIVAGLL